MIYLDASALVTYVTERSNYRELYAFLAGHPAVRGVTSTIGLIETVRNCDRVGSFPNLMTQLRREYSEMRITAEIRDRAANLSGGLTTLDSIHVVTAESLAENLTSLVTYDRRMAAAARSLGLPVVSPGLTP